MKPRRPCANWILRCASWLTPPDERAEWLEEWRGEAAYVRQRCGRQRSIRFSLGAFADAFWLRRQISRTWPARTRAIFNVESPVRCLIFLSILAAASLPLAVRPTHGDALLPKPIRDPEKLALLSRRPGITPRAAEIPVAEYRSGCDRIADAVDVAFYAPVGTTLNSKRFVVAVASPNLFRLLGAPVSTRGLILTASAADRYLRAGRRNPGQTLEIAGAPAVLAGIVSDGVVQLPGLIDGWLLDPDRLAALAPDRKGFMIARLRTPLTRNSLRWRMSVPDERGVFNSVGLAPLPNAGMAPFLFMFSVVAASFLLLLSLGRGEYPASRHAPSLRIQIRRWLFLLVKVALLWVIAVGGFLTLGALAQAAGAAVFCLAIALRWALFDQRNRCPVCLRKLSHPVRIGEASHMFLAWYGTELLCERGHGLLHVPEIRTSCYSTQRWLYLDPSWTA